MTNMFDDDTINIDEYKPDSKGVELAKKAIYTVRFCRIATVASIVLVYAIFIRENIFETYLSVLAYIILGLLIGLFWYQVNFFLNSSRGKIVNKLSDEEKFDYNYYVFYKRKNKSTWGRNNILVAMAINCALMGRKDKCREAISLVTYDYEPEVLKSLKEWVDSDAPSIEKEKVASKNKNYNALRALPLFIVWDLGLLAECIDYHVLIDMGLPQKAIGAIGFLQCLALVITAVIAAGLVATQNNRNKTFINRFSLGKTVKIILGIVLVIISMFAVFTNSALDYGLSIYNHEEELEEEPVYEEQTQDDYYDDYDADYENDYDIDGYYDYTAGLSEEYDDYYEDEGPQELDIMNKMIVLCNYLQKHGVIDDFSVELGYNAKGNVRGTVAKDDDYIYVLYDNGTKNDENGNECIELVLEAEPLDENGNSKGQQEAKLKGFYLVNLETDEVIDEHKTTW